MQIYMLSKRFHIFYIVVVLEMEGQLYTFLLVFPAHDEHAHKIRNSM